VEKEEANLIRINACLRGLNHVNENDCAPNKYWLLLREVTTDLETVQIKLLLIFPPCGLYVHTRRTKVHINGRGM
jgi:hypothetical protein